MTVRELYTIAEKNDALDDEILLVKDDWTLDDIDRKIRLETVRAVGVRYKKFIMLNGHRHKLQPIDMLEQRPGLVGHCE